MKKTWHKPGLLFIPSASWLSDPLCRRVPPCVPRRGLVCHPIVPAMHLSPRQQVCQPIAPAMFRSPMEPACLVCQQRPDVFRHPWWAYSPQLPVWRHTLRPILPSVEPRSPATYRSGTCRPEAGNRAGADERYRCAGSGPRGHSLPLWVAHPGLPVAPDAAAPSQSGD